MLEVVGGSPPWPLRSPRPMSSLHPEPQASQVTVSPRGCRPEPELSAPPAAEGFHSMLEGAGQADGQGQLLPASPVGPGPLSTLSRLPHPSRPTQDPASGLRFS